VRFGPTTAQLELLAELETARMPAAVSRREHQTGDGHSPIVGGKCHVV
jgi:hypothetical protein